MRRRERPSGSGGSVRATVPVWHGRRCHVPCPPKTSQVGGEIEEAEVEVAVQVDEAIREDKNPHDNHHRPADEGYDGQERTRASVEAFHGLEGETHKQKRDGEPEGVDEKKDASLPDRFPGGGQGQYSSQGWANTRGPSDGKRRPDKERANVAYAGSLIPQPSFLLQPGYGDNAAHVQPHDNQDAAG